MESDHSSGLLMLLYKVVNYEYMDRILVSISLGRNNTSAVELPLVLARPCSTLLSNHYCRFDPSLSQREMLCQDGFLNTFTRCKLGSKPCLHVESFCPNTVVGTLLPTFLVSQSTNYIRQHQCFPPIQVANKLLKATVLCKSILVSASSQLDASAGAILLRPFDPNLMQLSSNATYTSKSPMTSQFSF